MPVVDDVRLFEKLSLEGFQAGLSWLTILRKREAFRRAFAGFDFRLLAEWGDRDVERLLDGRRHRQAPRQDRVGARQRRARARARRGRGLAGGVRLGVSSPLPTRVLR